MRILPLFSFAASLLLIGSHVPVRHDVQSAAWQQEPACKLCPILNVECLDTVASGSPAKFSARILGAGPSPSLTLRWTVSAGAIITGQSTMHVSEADSTTDISVDTNGLSGNSTITATVEVDGLDKSCTSKSSCTTALIRPPAMEHFDQYGDINLEYEQARLDNYAIGVQNDPTMTGYIVCYGGRRGRRGEAAARCESAKNYLAGYRGIDARRLVLVDGGFREELMVELWMMPPEMKPPVTPTVNSGEVRFIEGPRKRKGRAARGRSSNERRLDESHEN